MTPSSSVTVGAARAARVDEDLRRGSPARPKARPRRGPGSGGFGDRFGGQSHGLEGALVDEAVDDAGAHPGRLGEVALEVDEAAFGRLQNAGPGGGQARRRRPGEADADARDLGPALRRAASGRGRGPSPSGARVYQAIQSRNLRIAGAMGGAARRRLTGLKFAAGPRPQAPDDADRLPGPERHLHDVAFRKDEAVGNGVGIGRVEGEGNEDVGDAR